MKERGPYKMRTIVRLTEFSPALLRAWERRHQLLRPLRGRGGHRLYTEEDLRVLLRVRELLKQGRSIGEIAGAGRTALLSQTEPQPPPAPLPEPPPEIGADVRTEIGRWRRSLVEAAIAMDGPAINRALDETFARVSAETAIFEVIRPTAQEIGDLWAAGRASVASEHLASGIFVHRIRKLLESAEQFRAEGPSVVIACFPDEQHQLGALILAYQLTRSGQRVSFLGAALPFDDLEAACQLLEPRGVLLSVARTTVYKLHRERLAETLRGCGDRFTVFVGGLGVPERDPELESLGAQLSEPSRDPHETLRHLLGALRSPRDRRP